MRTFCFALLLLVIIVTGLFLYNSFLIRESDALLVDIDRLSRAVDEGDWGKADEALDKMLSAWEKASPRLALFTDHSVLDDILLTTSAASGYARTREGPELCAELETLRSLVSHIPMRERLTLYNIF